MILLWLVASAALVAAFVALTQVRRTARRLEQLSQMYWELKYQQGELRVQLQRQQGEVGTASPAAPAPASPAPEGFIPLNSLKR